MLQVNVGARYTADEVLEHPWVQVRTHTHTFTLTHSHSHKLTHTHRELSRCHELVLVCEQDDAVMDTNMACEMEDVVESEITHNSTAAEAEVKSTHTHTQTTSHNYVQLKHCVSFPLLQVDPLHGNIMSKKSH